MGNKNSSSTSSPSSSSSKVGGSSNKTNDAPLISADAIENPSDDPLDQEDEAFLSSLKDLLRRRFALSPRFGPDRCAYCGSNPPSLLPCPGGCARCFYCPDRDCSVLHSPIHRHRCSPDAAPSQRAVASPHALPRRHMRKWLEECKKALAEAGAEDAAAKEEALLERVRQDPDVAWQLLQFMTVAESVPLELLAGAEERRPGHLRIVCISDTHSMHDKVALPAGDVLVHSGDFSNVGKTREVREFLEWFAAQDFKHKVVIAGNHDLTLHPEHYHQSGKRFHRNDVSDPLEARSFLTNPGFVYLEDQAVVIEGIKFYGTPWQPEFCDWAFNETRGKHIQQKWDLIPDDTDILISHGPPIGHGDYCHSGNFAGCVNLLEELSSRVKARVGIFGHIHEGYGATTNGESLFLNASTCTLRYRPINPPIVLDFPIPNIVHSN